MSEPSSHRHPLSKHAEMMAARRFFLLFVFLLATLILYPYTEDNGFRYYLLRFLGAAVVLLSVYAVSFRRSLLIVALVLAIPAFLQHTLLHEFNSSALSILRSFFSLVYDVFIIVVIFRRVFSHERPNAETVFGALCIYLLIGFGFAGLYGVVTALQPHSFYLDPLVNRHAIPDRFDFIYYSFGTMSSLGAAGITPVSGEARMLTVIETIIGVLYLAVLIARLMSAYRARETQP